MPYIWPLDGGGQWEVGEGEGVEVRSCVVH